MLFLNSRYKTVSSWFASLISTVISQELKYPLIFLILQTTSPVMFSVFLSKEVLNKAIIF